jgi:hypothetical protein
MLKKTATRSRAKKNPFRGPHVSHAWSTATSPVRVAQRHVKGHGCIEHESAIPKPVTNATSVGVGQD